MGVYVSIDLITCNIFIIDIKIEDSIKYFSGEDRTLDVVCNSEGFIEKFTGLNTDELLKNARSDLKAINKKIKIVSKDAGKVKKEFNIELQSRQQKLKNKFNKKRR